MKKMRIVVIYFSTMSKTVDKLFNSITADSTGISTAVINDYFGMKNLENINTIYGIYSGLIKIKGVSKELLENCFFTNRLDQLIHTKSKYHKSGYYLKFCQNNITIGNTYIGNSGIAEMPITDDDHCPCCQEKGYITENQNIRFMSPDCMICGKYMCKLCAVIQDGEGTCMNCLSKK